jgi:hypothetical protein
MRRIALFVFVVVLSLARSARADDAAEALLKEGVELRRAGKEVEALERFRKAQALSPSPRAQGQIGLAAKSLRLYVDAERALLAALGAGDDPWVQQNRAALELARDVVAKQLATLVVRSNVKDAEVWVNGAKLELAEPVRVLAGAARIEVRAPGHRPTHADHSLPAGETTELTINLDKVEPPTEPAQAPALSPLAPIAEPPPPPKSRRYVSYGVAGIGVVGLGVGTFFGVKTLDAKSDRDSLCNENTCTSDEGLALDREARSSATVSTIGFAVGIAALATAAVLFFTLR